ncbi:integrase arm-type DNA-binding domain-containing protein [Parasphingopyxis algicola]|uniref:tyrosine-type recombinase/integrase n=1 Tax=Parasphingopyxis algicola TaxID=2026624 RepID=UPI0015A3074B|nr:site-specific integrase [Parasphingopyxis algicola]QLC25082.1 integrase arm-type DNA-binding domain-containing protein [Parasphingopyxis algicola]
MSLTALKVKTAPPGRHGDGRGLYLVVKDSGTRSWVLRIQHRGRRRDLGLGPFPDVSLAEARIGAMELRKQVRAGLDPVAERRRGNMVIPSFETAARACYDALKEGWKNRRHASWIASLENHVFPAIGTLPVDEVDSAVVRDVLEPIWLTIPDTARRILQRIGAVLDFAHIRGWLPNEVSLRSVRKGLPRQTATTNHLAAMHYNEVPAFMAKLTDLPPTVGRDALRLTILTAVRSNETRLATWPEFDLRKALWTIPGARMKMNEPHIVPLSRPAIVLLRRVKRERSGHGDLVFSVSSDKPISDMTMIKVLRDMDIEQVTVHGFRSSFTDWVAEETDTPKEVADKALAHKIPNRVEAAYRRTDFLAKRRKLMAAWAAYCGAAAKA